ncbi:helix-turn-helix domain-containing protein [Tardiphaga sp. vice304]|uniref:helix-turn-helix domain-containing protein n=1 Tax=Tardiphaga sp. vice304 TaxID=2592817 RepID=UPI001FEEE3B6|nr:helix-turn-helix domain-containing protein [Tardiphaga sp. vice304]
MRKAAAKPGRAPVTKRKAATGMYEARRPRKVHAAVRPDEDPDSIDSVLLETARDMLEADLMDRAGYEKITMRHLKSSHAIGEIEAISAEQIRAMRERARMSQGVFAQVLNISPGYVSQLERGLKQPEGATLKLLSMIQRKGIDALL